MISVHIDTKVWDIFTDPRTIFNEGLVEICIKSMYALIHCGRVTQYGDGSMLCKTPIFFTMKEFPQI